MIVPLDPKCVQSALRRRQFIPAHGLWLSGQTAGLNDIALFWRRGGTPCSVTARRAELASCSVVGECLVAHLDELR